ncbi:TetR/AcrR family transcriptional regulator [Microbacterium sp. SS28]|uniref:TetR/AcrR family transcriptional regulator n=1 Tax=Microbacterium sp. SS28 TaxID=2919948 RepID=UPI001FA9ECCA|nr:TetR family transcriptional regulator [Microbacterium sp. SS28]
MPKVTEAYREARRDEIAQAAIRCLERNGVRDTSIADIVSESGLSTGAIYSHFTNKAELARYIVGRFLVVQIDELESRGLAGELVAPRDILQSLLGVFSTAGLSPGLVLQFWGEAMVDPDLHGEMTRTVGRLFGGLATAALPWARARAASEEAAHALAAETARTIAALAQGYIANTAILGPRDPAEYVESAASVLSP